MVTRKSAPRRFALTGTPGTGKSTAAAMLPRRWKVREVSDLAVELGAGHRRRDQVVVDLPRLRRRLLRGKADSVEVVVGHLAHLLPVGGAIVLRCHPRELERRLLRSQPGRPRARRANAVAEATDLVLLEALDRQIPVWEIDTTHRSPRSVARAVTRILKRRGPSRYGSVDWLADPSVTAHLLDRRT